MAILASFGCVVDFDKMFLPDDADLMRPNGGKYPGVSKEVDRPLADAAAPSESPSMQTWPDGNESLESANILAFDAAAVLATEKSARARSELDAQEPHSIWINLDEYGQKKAHKKTTLRVFMDPTMDIDNAKSHDRLLRIRYFSIGGDNW
ncbi:hypothetical protein B0H17DRAFT_961339, partial [Mycena rosella]